MSKHEKALRELFRVVKTDIPCRPEYRRKLWADAEAAADHIKRLEAQLRIAKRALKSWADYIPMHPDLDTLEDVQEAMRKAARRKTNG